MQKAFVKKNPPWVNYPDISTPIIADELNRVEDGIDTIDDRVVAFDTSKANQNDLLVTFKAVSFNTATGVFTFTKWNDTTVTVDTDIEKIAVNFDYDDDPTSTHYQSLVLTLSDGTIKYVDLSALITEYEFTDSSTIAFTVANEGSVSANVINGSITADKLQPNYLADITTQANNASASATSAGNSKLDSEAWANGTRNGTPVESTDPAYHNNSKYWKDQAQQIASGSIGGLSDVTIDTVTLANNQVLTYNSNTQQWENQANQDYSLKPHFVITSDTGSTVTVTKGGTTYTATETSTGIFECDVADYGTYTVTSVLGADTFTTTVSVDSVKVYNVDARHFHADITVTFPNDGTDTVTLALGGTVFTATSSPYTFTVHDSGNWVLNREVNGSDIYTKTFNVTTSGQTFSEDIPELLTLKGVQNVLDNARETTLLNVGDEVSAVDKNSNSLTYIIADINLYDTHEVILSNKYVSSAITSTPYDYENRTAVQSALTTIYNDFTDSDKALIKNKTVQFWTGGSVKTLTQKTWLPTRQEVNGGWASYETDMKQFALFTTQANRVKTNSGGTATRWQTSTGASNGTIFVAENGAIDSTTGSCGIAECFHLVADS